MSQQQNIETCYKIAYFKIKTELNRKYILEQPHNKLTKGKLNVVCRYRYNEWPCRVERL